MTLARIIIMKYFFLFQMTSFTDDSVEILCLLSNFNLCLDELQFSFSVGLIYGGIVKNYSPMLRWLVVDIYLAASR